ncbi:MAG: FecR family protein [Elusimicrobiota bacterium]
MRQKSFFKELVFICALMLIAQIIYAKNEEVIEKPKDEGFFASINYTGLEEKGCSIVYIKGNVEKQTHASTDWQKAAPGDRLVMGELVRTNENSLAALIFDEETLVYLQPKSRIILREVDIDTAKKIKHIDLELIEGKALIDTPNAAKDESGCTLQTKSALVIVHGTSFMVECDQDKSNISVYDGVVKLYNRTKTDTFENETLLKKGEESMVLGLRKPAPPSSVRMYLYEYNIKLQEMKGQCEKKKYFSEIKNLNKLREDRTTVFTEEKNVGEARKTPVFERRRPRR